MPGAHPKRASHPLAVPVFYKTSKTANGRGISQHQYRQRVLVHGHGTPPWRTGNAAYGRQEAAARPARRPKKVPSPRDVPLT